MHPSLADVNERGWGWSASNIREVNLAEWIAQHPGYGFITVTEFYEGLPDQAMNAYEVAYDDLQRLERRGLIKIAAAMGGIPALQVQPLQGVRDLAEELARLRADRRLRKTACRDAMVDWLYSLDAVSAAPNMPATEQMLDDLRHGLWWAKPFTTDDLDAAAAWLYRQGLVDGITVAECEGPVRLYLTDAGVTCVEDFGSDTRRYARDLQLELHDSEVEENKIRNQEAGTPQGTKIFVVHGHGGDIKYQVAEFLEKVAGERPVILHEQPDSGRTIIEKFEAHASQAGFAVVLLTADDVGRAKAEPELKPRARQNVVLELGFFIGSLGRSRVVALHEAGVELPSDLHGVLYKPLTGNWHTELAKELRAAGFNVNLSRLT